MDVAWPTFKLVVQLLKEGASGTVWAVVVHEFLDSNIVVTNTKKTNASDRAIVLNILITLEYQ